MEKELSFEEVVASHVNEKRAIGCKFKKEEQVLRRIVRMHSETDGTIPVLKKDFVLKWISKSDYESEQNRLHRISVMRGLSEYMVRMGFQAFQIPKKCTPYVTSTYVPHIFTNAELSKLFHAADSLRSTDTYPFFQIQYSLLFRLLYSTGMRSSEAMSLRKNDYSLDNGIIYIRDTKFGKERNIPISSELLQLSKNYSIHMQRYKQWGQSDYFFPNSKGNKLSDIYHNYRKVLWKAGISHGGRGYGPRLHDLRHTFAVHCLRNWVRSGKELSVLLPYLSVYMGHTGMGSTQHYLRLTAEIYPDIVSSLNHNYSWMIPEVTCNAEF